MKLNRSLKIFLFLIPFFQLVKGQNPALVDSLEKVIKTSQIDTVKVEALNKLAWQYRASDSAKAFLYLNQAEKLALECGDTLGYILSLNERGVVYKNRIELDRANYFYDLAFVKAKEAKSVQMMASVLNNKASVMRMQRDLS